ncbi:MAG TPA: thermonuclease family protein [Bauldia sp.]|nr:thermonuclease family protein [Bauldia sp.]
MKAALILIACLAAPPAMAECPTSAGEKTVVAEVMDGATVRLSDGGEMRLAGIEAPPRPLDLAASAPWSPGERARAGLARLVQNQTVALVEAGDGPDRYGRAHAYAFLEDGQSVAEALLGEGLVRARWWPEENGCFGRFLAAEASARLAGRGLWALPEFAVQPADDPSLARRNGLYDLVEGRVVSVGHGQRMIFLDFGADIRRDFTVMVAPAVADALAAAGRPVDGFSGQRVRVRGVIEESNGPAIRLNDPAEIELLKDEDAGAQR